MHFQMFLHGLFHRTPISMHISLLRYVLPSYQKRSAITMLFQCTLKYGARAMIHSYITSGVLKQHEGSVLADCKVLRAACACCPACVMILPVNMISTQRETTRDEPLLLSGLGLIARMVITKGKNHSGRVALRRRWSLPSFPPLRFSHSLPWRGHAEV